MALASTFIPASSVASEEGPQQFVIHSDIPEDQAQNISPEDQAHNIGQRTMWLGVLRTVLETAPDACKKDVDAILQTVLKLRFVRPHWSKKFEVIIPEPAGGQKRPLKAYLTSDEKVEFLALEKQGVRRAVTDEETNDLIKNIMLTQQFVVSVLDPQYFQLGFPRMKVETLREMETQLAQGSTDSDRKMKYMANIACPDMAKLGQGVSTLQDFTAYAESRFASCFARSFNDCTTYPNFAVISIQKFKQFIGKCIEDKLEADAQRRNDLAEAERKHHEARTHAELNSRFADSVSTEAARMAEKMFQDRMREMNAAAGTAPAPDVDM